MQLTTIHNSIMKKTEYCSSLCYSSSSKVKSKDLKRVLKFSAERVSSSLFRAHAFQFTLLGTLRISGEDSTSLQGKQESYATGS